MMLHNHLTLTL